MMLKANSWRYVIGSIFLASISRVHAEQIIADKVTIQTIDGPRLRLAQTGAIYPAYSWDIAGNETRFVIKDITAAGGPDVVTIASGSAANSFSIGQNGNIGFGRSVPIAPIDVLRFSQVGTAETLARFSVGDDSVGSLIIRNGSTTNGVFHPRIEGQATSLAVPLTMAGLVTLDSGTNPVVAFDAAKIYGGAVQSRPLVVFRNNLIVKARVAANGDMFATSFSPISSRSMKDKIIDLKSEVALEALRQLTPVEYIYKDDGSGERRVGFIAEDVPELVANADRKSVPIMDVLALITRVVKDQQQTITSQSEIIKNQQSSIEEQRRSDEKQNQKMDLLIKRLNALEARMCESK